MLILNSFTFLLAVKPYFKVLSKNTTALEGQPTMLHCLAEGDPKPYVKWDRNGEVSAIETNTRFQVRAVSRARAGVTVACHWLAQCAV